MLNVPVSEVILNEPSIRALIGQGEAASVAQHVGMGEQGQGSGGAVFSQEQVNGRAVQRLALLAYKERLAGRFILARSFSQALTALSSSPRRGCVVDNPPFNRATWSARLSVSTWSSFIRQASEREIARPVSLDPTPNPRYDECIN